MLDETLRSRSLTANPAWRASFMTDEQKRKRIELWAKIIGFGAVSFFVGPFVFMTLQGAAGLVALLLVWTAGNAFVPVCSRKVANWRLKALKAEAARNPIETMERDLLQKQQMHVQFGTALKGMIGTVESFGSKLAKTKREHAGSPEIEALEKNYKAMAQLVSQRKATYEKGKQVLVQAEKNLDRQRDIWELVIESRAMNKAISGDAESDFLAKLEMDSAHNSIQREMHSVFADIEMGLLEEGQAQQIENKIPAQLVDSFMKEKIAVSILFVCLSACAQTTTFIKGSMDIRFDTRTQKDKVGVADVYRLDINVANSVAFVGSITNTPVIYKLGFVSQAAGLVHDLNCEVINPHNPTQRKPIGRIYGTVPISPEGLYNYSSGTLGISGGDQNSKFSGTAQGKPIVKKKESFFSGVAKQASEIRRVIGGNVVSLIVTNYDNMVFNQTVLASGPLAKYPAVTVNGELKYDYDRLIWFFNNVNLAYYDKGQGIGDRLTGQISYDKKRNEYVFDVCVNEPPVNEASAFTTANAKDEESFFKVDTAKPGLRGTMRYKDQMAGDVVTASRVDIDLAGTQITQAQTMNLFKLVILACIVPMNNE